MPDEVVRKWVLAVIELGPDPAIVSLLGQKPDGTSEYSFYSFFGGFDLAQEHRGRRSFAEWLAKMTPDVAVVEHPTIDFQAIPTPTLDAIEADARALLSQRRTIVIVDSGGETRTGRVCKHIGAKEVFPTIG